MKTKDGLKIYPPINHFFRKCFFTGLSYFYADKQKQMAIRAKTGLSYEEAYLLEQKRKEIQYSLLSTDPNETRREEKRREEKRREDWNWASGKKRALFLTECGEMLFNDKRILNDIDALQSLGYDVLLIGFTQKEASYFTKHDSGLNVFFCGTNYRKNYAGALPFFPDQIELPNLNIFSLPLFFFGKTIEKPDLIFCQNFSGLIPGVLLHIHWKIPVFYEAREHFSSQFDTMTKRESEAILNLETLFMRLCTQWIHVSQSLVDWYKEHCHLQTGATIYSVLPYLPEEKLQGKLHTLCHLPSEIPIILFCGNFMKDRGLDLMIEAIRPLSTRAALVFLGPSTPWTEENEAILKAQAGELLDKRIFFLPGVKQHEIAETIADAAFGIFSLLDSSVQVRFSMPNKLFEYIQGGLPILCNQNQESASKIVQSIDGGLSLPMNDAKAMETAFRQMLDSDLQNMRKNVLAHRYEYSWDHEREKLKKLITEAIASYSAPC